MPLLVKYFIQKFINRLLIEKPDFYKNKEVGIAALILYSKYLCQEEGNTIQLSLFNSDYLVEEFEKFINVILKRNSLAVVESFYETNRSFETLENTTIVVLNKRKTFLGNDCISSNDKKIFKTVPKFLYCRESFLKNNS